MEKLILKENYIGEDINIINKIQKISKNTYIKKSSTGLGMTTFYMNQTSKPTIVISPTVGIIQGKEEVNTNPNILFIYSNTKDHWNKLKEDFTPNIMTTPDQLVNLFKFKASALRILMEHYILIIDESDTYLIDSFRERIPEFIDYIRTQWTTPYIITSATENIIDDINIDMKLFNIEDKMEIQRYDEKPIELELKHGSINKNTYLEFIENSINQNKKILFSSNKSKLHSLNANITNILTNNLLKVNTLAGDNIELKLKDNPNISINDDYRNYDINNISSKYYRGYDIDMDVDIILINSLNNVSNVISPQDIRQIIGRCRTTPGRLVLITDSFISKRIEPIKDLKEIKKDIRKSLKEINNNFISSYRMISKNLIEYKKYVHKDMKLLKKELMDNNISIIKPKKNSHSNNAFRASQTALKIRMETLLDNIDYIDLNNIIATHLRHLYNEYTRTEDSGSFSLDQFINVFILLLHYDLDIDILSYFNNKTHKLKDYYAYINKKVNEVSDDHKNSYLKYKWEMIYNGFKMSLVKNSSKDDKDIDLTYLSRIIGTSDAKSLIVVTLPTREMMFNEYNEIKEDYEESMFKFIEDNKIKIDENMREDLIYDAQRTINMYKLIKKTKHSSQFERDYAFEKFFNERFKGVKYVAKRLYLSVFYMLNGGVYGFGGYDETIKGRTYPPYSNLSRTARNLLGSKVYQIDIKSCNPTIIDYLFHMETASTVYDNIVKHYIWVLRYLKKKNLLNECPINVKEDYETLIVKNMSKKLNRNMAKIAYNSFLNKSKEDDFLGTFYESRYIFFLNCCGYTHKASDTLAKWGINPTGYVYERMTEVERKFTDYMAECIPARTFRFHDALLIYDFTNDQKFIKSIENTYNIEDSNGNIFSFDVELSKF